MPPTSKANIRIFCSQKLEIEDVSYCLRIPMTYVPSYMGQLSNFFIPPDSADDDDPLEQEDFDSILHLSEVEELPVKNRSCGLWDINVNVISSTGHL